MNLPTWRAISGSFLGPKTTRARKNRKIVSEKLMRFIILPEREKRQSPDHKAHAHFDPTIPSADLPRFAADAWSKMMLLLDGALAGEAICPTIAQSGEMLFFCPKRIFRAVRRITYCSVPIRTVTSGNPCGSGESKR